MRKPHRPIHRPALFAMSLFAFMIIVAIPHGSETNLALGKTCKASSVEGQNIPGKATDGKLGQGFRWGSNYLTDKNKDSAWIFVDLGQASAIDSIAIYWEHSGAKQYAIQVWKSQVDTPSYNDSGWTTILYDTTLYYQPKPVDMCLSFLKPAPVQARYVRVRCYKRLFEFGYSIMELEVFGAAGTVSVSLNLRADPRVPERPGLVNLADGRFAGTRGMALRDGKGGFYSATGEVLSGKALSGAALSIARPAGP